MNSNFKSIKKHRYNKPYTSVEQQIKLLSKKGMKFKNFELADTYLTRTGYFCLSFYWYVLREKNDKGKTLDQFRPETYFEDAVRYYKFDQKLKGLVQTGIGTVEVSLRALWANSMAKKYGPHAYLNEKLFSEETRNKWSGENVKVFSHREKIEKLEDSLERMAKYNPEVKFYVNHYSGPSLPPIWMMTAFLDFGELNAWIKHTKDPLIKNYIANTLGFRSLEVFHSVLKNFQALRNICAHHNRLWGLKINTRLKISTDPKISSVLHFVPNPNPDPRQPRMILDTHIYNELVMLAYVLRHIKADLHWTSKITELINSDLIEIEQGILGAPEGWATTEFWKGPGNFED